MFWVLEFWFIFFLVEIKCTNRSKSISILISLYLGSALFMFLLLPFCPCKEKEEEREEEVIIDESLYDVSTINAKPYNDSTTNNTDTIIKIPVEIGPKPKRSIYRKHVRHIDEGKKLLCFFAPGCDHCKEAVRDIYKLY